MELNNDNLKFNDYLKFNTHEHYAYKSDEFKKKKTELGSGHNHYKKELGSGHNHYNLEELGSGHNHYKTEEHEHFSNCNCSKNKKSCDCKKNEQTVCSCNKKHT